MKFLCLCILMSCGLYSCHVYVSPGLGQWLYFSFATCNFFCLGSVSAKYPRLVALKYFLSILCLSVCIQCMTGDDRG